MHISFDLDDTLICPNEPFEPLRPWGRLLAGERLRLGTRALFRQLQAANHSLSIYTSSHRSHGQIRRLFRAHGLRLHKVVNGDDHADIIAASPFRVAKLPEAFDFAIHVDDQPLTEQDGAVHARVVLAAPGVTWWHEVSEKILAATDPSFA